MRDPQQFRGGATLAWRGTVLPDRIPAVCRTTEAKDPWRKMPKPWGGE